MSKENYRSRSFSVDEGFDYEIDSKYPVRQKFVNDRKCSQDMICENCKEREDKICVLEMEIDLKNQEIEQLGLQIANLQKKLHLMDLKLDKNKNKQEKDENKKATKIVLFIEKKQMPDESCYEYALKLRQLGLKALGNSLSDELLLSLFVQGLRHTEAKAHLLIEIMMKNIKSFKEAMEFTENFEDACVKSEVGSSPKRSESDTPPIRSVVLKSEVVVKTLKNNNNYVRTEVDLDLIDDSMYDEGEIIDDDDDSYGKSKTSRSYNSDSNCCRYCGQLGHWERSCRMKGSRCYNCKEKGHYSRFCPKRMKKDS